jgi:hypothetical protein
MSRLRHWMFLAFLAGGLAVMGCHAPASTAKPTGWFGSKASPKSDAKRPSKPLPRDTIPSAKDVGL